MKKISRRSFLTVVGAAAATAALTACGGSSSSTAASTSSAASTAAPASTANLLTSVNRLNKKIRKRLLPGAVKHPATLISRQHSLSAENHRNSSSEIINRHQKMAENAEIQ